jgi:hypothetical protein
MLVVAIQRVTPGASSAKQRLLLRLIFPRRARACATIAANSTPLGWNSPQQQVICERHKIDIFRYRVWYRFPSQRLWQEQHASVIRIKTHDSHIAPKRFSCRIVHAPIRFPNSGCVRQPRIYCILRRHRCGCPRSVPSLRLLANFLTDLFHSKAGIFRTDQQESLIRHNALRPTSFPALILRPCIYRNARTRGATMDRLHLLLIL